MAFPFVMAAQPSPVSASDALVDLLVFGANIRIDPAAYPAPVATELRNHLRRFNAYRSKRTGLAKTGEFRMVHDAYVLYERRLAAVSADPKAPGLALAYVSELKPCYEWEGYHDCPEREAAFAGQYQAAHPDGPFSRYLPLLAAHRWLCAAEGYDYEKQPEGAARSRRAYAETIVAARQSKSPMVRMAAGALSARRSCFSEH